MTYSTPDAKAASSPVPTFVAGGAVQPPSPSVARTPLAPVPSRRRRRRAVSIHASGTAAADREAGRSAADRLPRPVSQTAPATHGVSRAGLPLPIGVGVGFGVPAPVVDLVDRTVEAAMSAPFACDELLGPGLSRLVSVASSVVKRHGAVLETTLPEMLEASGRWLVWRQVEMPITDAADALVASSEPEDLERLCIDAFGRASRVARFDLVAVCPAERRAVVVECKRGSGITETKKQRLAVRDLTCARLQLKSFLAPRFVGEIRRIEAVVIDYYGRSGFDPAITVTRETLDAFFDVPIVAVMEAATARLAEALHRQVPQLLALAGRTPGPERPVPPLDFANMMAPRRTPGHGRGARTAPRDEVALPLPVVPVGGVPPLRLVDDRLALTHPDDHRAGRTARRPRAPGPAA